MTSNQIEYWKLQELKRANLINEEQARLILAEQRRHNTATEANDASRIQVSRQSNLLTLASNQEQARANFAREENARAELRTRSSVASIQAETSRYAAELAARSAQTVANINAASSQKVAATQASASLGVANINAATSRYVANTNYKSNVLTTRERIQSDQTIANTRSNIDFVLGAGSQNVQQQRATNEKVRDQNKAFADYVNAGNNIFRTLAEFLK